VPGAAAGNVTYRATAGAKPRQGSSRFLLVADRKIDARSQAQDSPRRTSGHAAQIRGSEHDHRRLKASPPPLHDHNLDSFRHRLWGRMPSCASALDKGHQSKNTPPTEALGQNEKNSVRVCLFRIGSSIGLSMGALRLLAIRTQLKFGTGSADTAARQLQSLTFTDCRRRSRFTLSNRAGSSVTQPTNAQP